MINNTDREYCRVQRAELLKKGKSTQSSGFLVRETVSGQSGKGQPKQRRNF